MIMEILDASALIAFIKKERGYKEIEKLFLLAESKGSSLFIHQINFIEFIYKCHQIFELPEFNKIIGDLQTPLLGVMNYMDADIGFYAGHLKSEYHLSLADAMGMACAKVMKGRFWTADKALLSIAEKEKIELRIFR
jgi:predicted nucleic acid-binding protein